tara:strand:+ start:9324 stop:9929 length:606 start_codon:yes stop_codon:yes gene_type:complete
MEPATLISLSSVFGLMATFFQERRGRKEAQTQATLQEYIEWLERGRHTELVELLRSNQDLMTATDRFMRTGHEEILDRFDQLEETLAQSLISTPGWAELTQSLNPKARLSKQAVDILRWFDATGASNVIELRHHGGTALVPMEGSGGHGNYEPEPDEARFFEADLELLCDLGLLIDGMNSKGDRKYTIKREAVDLVRSLGE